MDVIHDEDHPELIPTRTDPAELAWHLYRHHGLDLSGLTDLDGASLWTLHQQHHAGD